MQVERVISKLDFTSELIPTENTNLLLRNNQINREYYDYLRYFMYYYYWSYGWLHPRKLADNISEEFLFYDTLNTVAGFTVYNTVSIIDDPYKYIDRSYPSTEVADLYDGWLEETTGLTSDGGADRYISFVFALSDADLLAGTKVLFTQRISSNVGYHIAFTNRRLYIRFYDSANNLLLDEFVTATLLESKKWYHLVLTHSNNTVKVFIDGILIKQLAYSGTIDYVNPFMIGNMLAGGYHFRGLFRSLTIGSEYLTDEKVYLFHKYFKETFEMIPFYKDTGYDFLVTRSGTWVVYYDDNLPKPGYASWSNTAGNYVNFTFTGAVFHVWIPKESGISGVVDIYLDGVFEATIDTSTLPTGLQTIYEVEGLGAGEHTLKIEIVSGTFVFYGAEAFIDTTRKMIENVRYLEADTPQTYYAIEKSLPRLMPRFEYDGVDETKLLFYRYLDSTDEDLITYDGLRFHYTYGLTERNTNFDKTVKSFDHLVATYWYNAGYCKTNNAPVSDGGTDRTISIWFKPESGDLDGNTHCLVTQRTATNNGYHLGIRNTGAVYATAYNSSNTLIVNLVGTTVLEAGRWYNVMLTHNSTNCYLYLNSVLDVSGSITGTVDYVGYPFWFGRKEATWQYYGQLSGFFIYSGYLNSTQINDYIDNAKQYRRVLPQHCTVALSNEDTDFKMRDSASHKDIFLNKGESYKITFTGKKLTVYGSYANDGAVGHAYVKITPAQEEYLFYTGIDCYSASYAYDVICEFEADTFGTYTLEIYNTSEVEDNFIFISECVFEYGNNQIKDYSGFNNHCEIINYTDGYIFDVLGLNRYAYALQGAGGDTGYIRLNKNIYQTLGDKYLFAMWFKPDSRATSGITYMTLLDTDYNTEPETDEFISVGYFQDFTNSKDILEFYDENCISQTVDIPELQIDDWYFLAFTGDNVAQEIKVLLCQQSDNTVLLDTTLAFNISPYTYLKEDIRPIWIGWDSGGYDAFEGSIDSVLFEGSTERTIEDMKEYFYLNAPTNGGTLLDGNINVDEYNNLRLYKQGVNSFPKQGQYISKIYKLQNGKFSGYGKLLFTSEVNDFTSIYDIQTRTSANAETNTPTWNSWVDLGEDSAIDSPNLEYLQFRFKFEGKWDFTDSPTVSKIEILDIDADPFQRKAFSLPIIYDVDTNLKEAVINKNTESYIVEELNGAKYIEFTFPYTNKRDSINIEGLIQMYNEMYTIRKIEDIRQGNILLTKVYAEAGFYNLQYSAPIKEKEFAETTPDKIIKYVLSDTGWELGETDIFLTRDFSIENNSNCLQLLRSIQKLYGGDLKFDSKIKKVYLYEDSGIDNGVIFSYKRNIEISREIDSYDYVNRLYIYGNGGISIAEHNNGLEYIDLAPVTNIPFIKNKTVSNEDITDTEILYKYGLYLAEKYKTENIVYNLKAKYLETNNNNLPEYNVGDIITVYDKDLDITLQTRITSMKYDVLNPINSELELSSTTRNLGDDLSEFMRYTEKFKKINFRVLINMMRNYVFANTRYYGWIEKKYIAIYKTSAINTSAGLVIMNDPGKTYVDVFENLELNIIVGTLKSGDEIKIIGEYGKYYKIQFYGVNV